MSTRDFLIEILLRNVEQTEAIFSFLFTLITHKL